MRYLQAVLAGLVLAAGAARADGDGVTLDGDTVLVKRGPAVITLRDFEAELAHIPDQARQEVADSPTRLSDLLSNLVKERLVAEQARNAGMADDPDVKAALRIADDRVLADAQLKKVVRESKGADYEAMAREYYLAHPDEFMLPERIDVSHILVSTKDRSDEDARERAQEVLQKLQSGDASFEDLVKAYSDDPSASSNQGHLINVRRGKLVKPFEEAAFGLEQPGDIAGPVKTPYGYHIIRLDAHQPAGKQPFGKVEADLVQRMQDKQAERVRGQYIDTLIDSNPLEADKAVIQALRDKYRHDRAEQSSDD